MMEVDQNLVDPGTMQSVEPEIEQRSVADG